MNKNDFEQVLENILIKSLICHNISSTGDWFGVIYKDNYKEIYDHYLDRQINYTKLYSLYNEYKKELVKTVFNKYVVYDHDLRHIFVDYKNISKLSNNVAKQILLLSFEDIDNKHDFLHNNSDFGKVFIETIEELNEYLDYIEVNSQFSLNNNIKDKILEHGLHHHLNAFYC